MSRFNVEFLSRKDWRAVIESNPDHSVFSRLEWYELFERTYPGRFQPLFVRCYNVDKEILFPCMKERSRFRLTSIASSPMGGTSNFFSERRLTLSDLDSISEALADQCGAHQVVLKPSPLMNLDEPGENEEAGSTHVLDLRPEYRELAGNYLHKARKNLAKAQRSGLSVTLGRREDVKTFHRMFRKLYLERFRKSPEGVLPLSFYELMFDSCNVDLVVVRQSPTDEIVSATVCLFSPYEYFQLHNATNYDFASVRPNDVWEDFAVRRGKSLGAQFLNFGASPSEGVERFKESFGAKKIRIPIIHRERRLAHWASIIRKARQWTRSSFGKAVARIEG